MAHLVVVVVVLFLLLALLLAAPVSQAIEHRKTTLPVMHRCITCERFFFEKKSISYISRYQRAYLHEQ